MRHNNNKMLFLEISKLLAQNCWTSQDELKSIDIINQF